MYCMHGSYLYCTHAHANTNNIQVHIAHYVLHVPMDAKSSHFGEAIPTLEGFHNLGGIPTILEGFSLSGGLFTTLRDFYYF